MKSRHACCNGIENPNINKKNDSVATRKPMFYVATLSLYEMKPDAEIIHRP